MTHERPAESESATSLTWQRFRAVLIGLGIAAGLAIVIAVVLGLAVLGQLLAVTLGVQVSC